MHHYDDDTSNLLELHVEGRARLAHLRGLDGLRGLAVAGVVAFHAGFSRMVGGYLGVSTFFTLSGFLITSLLLTGVSTEGGIVLRGFWGRRIRRLFPASVTTLILVLALFAPFVATPDQLATLPGDALASLANVANWRFILQGSSYGDLFTAPSPLLHFWSLAIEEQFYLVFPLVLWAIVAAVGRRRRLVGRPRVMLGTVLAVLAALSLAWTLFGGLSVDHIYFGTITRASELLLGAVLAVVLSSRQVRRRLALSYRWRTLFVVLGAVALAVQLWWWWTLEQSTTWLYRGGFTLYAALTCLVIIAAATPVGPVFAVLKTAPLRWLGARSYAIYLIHWPLFLTFRQLWPDLSRWITTAAVVTISLLLAELSFHVLERPIRLRTRLPGRRGIVAGVGSAIVVVILVFTVIPHDPPGRRPDFDADLADFQNQLATRSPGRSTTTIPGADTEEAADPPAPVPTVAVYGDSTALGMGMGLAAWGTETSRLTSVLGDLRFGCGVPRFAELKAETRVVPDQECLAWPTRWTRVISETKPNVVLLSSPAWSVPDARLPGGGGYSAIGDPAVDNFVREEFLKAVDVLSADGALVLLVQWPAYGQWHDDGMPDAVADQGDPARMQRLNEILGEVAAQRPGKAEVVDLAGWVGDRAQDPTLRVDGVHFTPEEFLKVSRDWFGPEVEKLWQGRWDDLLKLQKARSKHPD